MSDQDLPPRLREIVAEFAEAEGREKLELLLEYADRMPPLPPELQNHQRMDQVHECASPVFIHAQLLQGGMRFTFDVPEEAPTVRGYAALIAEGVNGSPPAAILQIPADFYFRMGLQKVLTPQRMNGITAILAYMKRLAVRELSA